MSKSLRSKRTLSCVGLGCAALAAMSFSGLVGCDTVARVSFPDVNFERMEVAGLVPPAGSCGGSSGRAQMRFVMLDTRSNPITNQTTIGGQQVSLDADDLGFSQSAVFELPATDCTSGACTVAGAVQFMCQAARPGVESQCNTSTDIAPVGAPAFASDLGASHLFGMAFENTGSLSGQIPSSVSNLYPDINGDGNGENVPNITTQITARASDPNRVRASSFLSQAAETWKISRNFAQDNFQTQSYFGLWTFSGTGATVESRVPSSEATTGWTNSPTQADAAVSAFPTGTQSTVAAVYASAKALLSDGGPYTNPSFADYKKTLVLFVDGPDERRLSAATAQDVIDAATATNTRVFIVHLDSEIQTSTDGGAQRLLFDDPEYVRDQDECADEDSCRNYEECRPITSYSTNPGSAVSTPLAEKRGKSFCVPKRDDNGRVGPVDEYAQIACETGGSYIYVPDPLTLAPQASWLPYVQHGLWEVPLNINAFNSGFVNASDAHLIQTDITASVGGRTNPKSYSQQGAFQSDNRLVLFSE